MSRHRRGRPAMGAVSGLFFGISVSLLLLTLGHVAVESSVLLVVPILFLVAGTAWALWAPLWRRPPAAFATTPPPARPFVVPESPAVAGEPSGEGVDEGGGGSSPV